MMNILKKLAACGLSLTMVLSLAACGGSTDDTASNNDTSADGGETVKYLIGIRTCDSGQLSKLAKLARRVSAVHCGQQDFYEPIIQQSGCTIREACARIMWEILHPGEPEGFRL